MAERTNRRGRPRYPRSMGRVTAAATTIDSATRDTSENLNPIERSSSAFPTLNESMGNISTGTTLAISKDVRSQSVRQINRRRPLCSAVPDLVTLSPIDRPDNGGSKGQTITLYTNHFPVDIDKLNVYQYDVEIVMIDRNQKTRTANKDDRWNALQTFVKERKNYPVVWYDESKTLYSREILPDVQLPVQIRLKVEEEAKLFQINKLNLVEQSRISDIHDFIEKRTNLRPREAIRIVEILFNQRARNDLINIRNQFYDRHQNPQDLDDGRCMAKGFYQALYLTQSGPTLNINLTFTCFYMPLQFVDFATKYLRKDVTRGLAQRDLDQLKKIIANLKIETMHTGRRIFYRFRDFGRSANEITFTCNNDDPDSPGASAVKEITVANYFATKFRKLIYPKLPCINGIKGNENKPNWLPMEVVRVVEWQRALKPLDKQQRGTVSRNTILEPQQRYNEIMKIVRNNNFNRDRYLRELNINVHDKEMLQLQGRVLPAPDIRYRRNQGEVIEQVRFGKWRVRNWFFHASIINSWGMIYFGDRPNRDVTQDLQCFQNELPRLLRRSGFQINEDPSLTVESSYEDDIRRVLTNTRQQNWQLAIIIMNCRNSDDVYNLVKNYANGQLGLMTQCVNYQALKRNIRKLDMYVENISQKINGKLGGINGVVNIKEALSRSSREDLFMFFGADVTHSTCSSDRPSIAAVVGSRDLTNSLYTARLCEQYPKKGRCSVEIIKELDKMVMELLQVFAKGCGNQLPNRIVFYRDGVDDGQYQKVLDHEVTKVKAACRDIYGSKSQPKLTFIIVKKRHNTRFFFYENNKTSNIPAGTVIDQVITHPSQFDFYLCSQAAGMGTSRPALYHVLHDDNQFTSDEIQQLTYWLCHTDMRCTKSVSIPAPVHYAHLAAYASRIMKFGEDHDQESLDGENGEPENYSLDDIKTKLMVLDSKIADDMWFI